MVRGMVVRIFCFAIFLVSLTSFAGNNNETVLALDENVTSISTGIHRPNGTSTTDAAVCSPLLACCALDSVYAHEVIDIFWVWSFERLGYYGGILKYESRTQYNGASVFHYANTYSLDVGSIYFLIKDPGGYTTTASVKTCDSHPCSYSYTFALNKTGEWRIETVFLDSKTRLFEAVRLFESVSYIGVI